MAPSVEDPQLAPQIAARFRPILPQLGFPDKCEPLPLGRDAWESTPLHSQAQEIADFAVVGTHLALEFQRTRQNKNIQTFRASCADFSLLKLGTSEGAFGLVKYVEVGNFPLPLRALPFEKKQS